jgi:hypothetical protein
MSTQYLSQTSVFQDNINLRVNNIICQNAYIQSLDISTFTVNSLDASNIETQFLTAQSIGTDTLISTNNTFLNFDATFGDVTDFTCVGLNAVDISCSNILNTVILKAADISCSKDLDVSGDTNVNNLTVKGLLTFPTEPFHYDTGATMTFTAGSGTGDFNAVDITANIIPMSGLSTDKTIVLQYKGANTNVNLGSNPTILEAIVPDELGTLANMVVGYASVTTTAKEAICLVQISATNISIKDPAGSFANGAATIHPFTVTYNTN